MSVRKESNQENYEIIVIGSGMGGLSVAALLAKAGKKVLVVERHDRPGGYAHAFLRNRYHFDSAIHMTAGCEPVSDSGTLSGGLIDRLLRIFDVRDRCNFVKINPFYSVLFPDAQIVDIPTGIENFTATHVAHFPDEEKGLRSFMKTCIDLTNEATKIPGDLSIFDFLKVPRKYPTVFKYHKSTLQQVLDEHIQNAKLKSILGALWPYLGLPPSKLSFLYWSFMNRSFLEEGAYYCQGTFQNLVNAFVESLRKNDGELILQSRVRRVIISKDNAVGGVILENGQRISAPVVISNADATQTFEELVGVENTPEQYLSKLRKMKPSLSAFVVYLATDLNLVKLGAKHEMFLYKTWNHDETFLSIFEGKPAGIAITVPTLSDPSLAPPGEHIVIVTTLIPYEIGSSWREQKSKYAEMLMQEVEKVFPGIRNHITFSEGASPRTMERYTLNLTGAIYGWEVSPEQVGRGRLAHETPIKGLYLSGHWTQPGGGLYGVTLSGVDTARSVLGYRNIMECLNALSKT
jgi:phytoene desaturase